MQLSKITNSSNPKQTVEALVHNTIALNEVVETHTEHLDTIDEQVEQLFGQTEEIGNELQDANVNIAANKTSIDGLTEDVTENSEKIAALEGQFSASSPWKLASNPTINVSATGIGIIFDSSTEQAVTEYFTSVISLDTPLDSDMYWNASNIMLTNDTAVSGGGYVLYYPFFIPAGTQNFILHGKVEGGIFINETIIPGGTTLSGGYKNGKSYIVTTPAQYKSGLDSNSDFINKINSEYKYLPRAIQFGLISGKTITGDAKITPTFYKTKG